MCRPPVKKTLIERSDETFATINDEGNGITLTDRINHAVSLAARFRRRMLASDIPAEMFIDILDALESNEQYPSLVARPFGEFEGLLPEGDLEVEDYDDGGYYEGIQEDYETSSNYTSDYYFEETYEEEDYECNCHSEDYFDYESETTEEDRESECECVDTEEIRLV